MNEDESDGLSGRPHRGGVRVWGYVGVTVAITEDPPQFVRVLFGLERIAPNDKPATIKKYEEQIFTYCEKAVNRRVGKIRKMMS